MIIITVSLYLLYVSLCYSLFVVSILLLCLIMCMCCFFLSCYFIYKLLFSNCNFSLCHEDWLVEQIKTELHSWCPTSLPPDPIDLSFWVAHNLPVNDEMRLRLLTIDSVVQRLRFGLNIIRKVSSSMYRETIRVHKLLY